jgi:hypothetical protein
MIDNHEIYNYNFDGSKIIDSEIIDNTEIFYTSLEDWLVLYTLMGRTNKVALIKKYFETSFKLDEKLLEKALKSAPKKIKQDIEFLGVTYPIPWDLKSTVKSAYGIQAIPATYLIDKNGKIRYEHTGFTLELMDELYEAIGELIKE